MTIRRNPWGRLVEAGRDGPSVDLAVLESKFREVGLSEADAGAAARGLSSGTYLSFADAAHSRFMWGSPVQRHRLSLEKVAEVAATVDGPQATRHEPVPGPHRLSDQRVREALSPTKTEDIEA